MHWIIPRQRNLEISRGIRKLIKFRLSPEGRFLRPKVSKTLLTRKSWMRRAGDSVWSSRKDSRFLVGRGEPNESFLSSFLSFPDLEKATLLFGKKGEKTNLISPMEIQAWKLYG